ncbi:MAG: hypothetical protein QOI74_2744 [Micromonosporaceae bacterium]|jgi:hypothetical protein|nr:hypothetical protein [Micromonosporaceae bacterium]
MAPRQLTVVGSLVWMLALGLITGCAGGAQTPSAAGSGVPGSPGPSASDGSTPAPSSSAGASPSSPGAGAASPPTGDITLTGQIETGVEAHCLILRTNGSTYQLMGGDANIVKAGSNVVVTGHVVKGIMSYCMQGQPFQISQARLM